MVRDDHESLNEIRLTNGRANRDVTNEQINLGL